MRRLAALTAVFALTAMAPAASPLAKVQGDGFSMMMPGQPELTTELEEPGPAMINTWSVTDENILYAARVVTYPHTPPAEVYDRQRDELIRLVKGRLSSEAPVLLGGKSGTELVLSSADQEMKARIFLVKEHLFTLLVVYDPSKGSGSGDAFLKSLRLER